MIVCHHEEDLEDRPHLDADSEDHRRRPDTDLEGRHRHRRPDADSDRRRLIEADAAAWRV